MLAKMTSRNRLTLPKRLIDAIGPTEYFDVQTKNGQIILTPVRILRADAVRVKLGELDLTDQDLANAMSWARQSSGKARNA
jgi:hypothetical protein